ncbi:MAG: hypothetical protein WA144_06735 [Candidatus Methanoperedens sp.]
MKPITQMKKWTQGVIGVGIVAFISQVVSGNSMVIVIGNAIIFGALAWYIETRKPGNSNTI